MLFPSDLTYLNAPNLHVIPAYIPTLIDSPYFGHGHRQISNVLPMEMPDGFVCYYLLYAKLTVIDDHPMIKEHDKEELKVSKYIDAIMRKTTRFMEDKMSAFPCHVSYLFRAMMTWEVATKYEIYLNKYYELRKHSTVSILQEMKNTTEYRLLVAEKDDMNMKILNGEFDDYFEKYSDNKLRRCKQLTDSIISLAMESVDTGDSAEPVLSASVVRHQERLILNENSVLAYCHNRKLCWLEQFCDRNEVETEVEDGDSESEDEESDSSMESDSSFDSEEGLSRQFNRDGYYRSTTTRIRSYGV